MNSKKKKDEKPLSKKELKRLEKERKLEEERKAREEEEARIAEEKRLREEELERRRQEELAYRQAEAARLSEERMAFTDTDVRFRQGLEEAITKVKEKTEWENYLMCQETVNIEREQDLNMFLTMMAEMTIKDFKTFEGLLDKMDEALELVRRIHVRLLDCICTPNPKLESLLLVFGERLVSATNKKVQELHSFVMHMAETIVAQRLKELRAAAADGSAKAGKVNDSKPEVQVSWKRRHIAVSYWIMGFENSGIRPTPIDHRDLFFMSDLPKAFFSKKLVMFGVKYSDNFVGFKRFFRFRTEDQPETQIRSEFWPVEGFTEIGCLNLLPDSREVGEIVVKRLFTLKESLQYMSIPTMEGANPNFRIYFFVTDSRRLEEKEEVMLCYWDREKRVWTREGLGTLLHDQNEYKKRLQITGFVPCMAPYCLMQPIMSHMPYNNFVIRRVRPAVLKLDIMTSKVFLSIKIKPGTVTVCSTNLKCLSFLQKKVLSPSELLLQLAEANVLLVPRIHDLLNERKPDSFGTKVESQVKIPATPPVVTPVQDVEAAATETPAVAEEGAAPPEPPKPTETSPRLDAKDRFSVLKNGCKSFELAEFVTEEICRNVLNFYIQLSKFNCQSGRDSVILSLMLNPNSVDIVSKEALFKLRNVHYSLRKCELLKVSEEEEVLSFERAPATVSHLNLQTLCLANASEMGVSEPIPDSFSEQDYLLIDTLRKLIQPMDLITYCN